MNEQTIIETKQATIRFDGLVAVDNVDFAMKDGEAVGIIGPNGAGKTTFFNLLTGFFPPTEGKIYYAGKDITAVPEYDRVMLGIVRTFQLVSVFDSLPVLDNLVLSTIRFGNDYKAKNKFFFGDAHRSDIMATCMEELEVMGITDKAKLMTSELSYGDKRKLEIAVALSLKPKILLLDEPFAGLSDQEIGEVSRIISRVKEQLSLVIIEHKISRIVDLIQRLCVMHEGKLIAEGAPVGGVIRPQRARGILGKRGGTDMLSVKNIDVAYGHAKVLHDISLELAPGEMVFIAGRNGAGKTTFLKSIAGFVKPSQGTIMFYDKNIAGLPPEKVALLGIRYVFQDKRVFSQLTVKENLELAAYPVKEKISDAIAKVVSIYPKIEKFLELRAGSLSGGQRQILLIGRALVGNPKLLLIDEPTEGLAAGTINDILNVLAMMKGKVPMIIVEQNLSVVGMLADKVYIMKEGKIIREVTDEAEMKDKLQLEQCL